VLDKAAFDSKQHGSKLSRVALAASPGDAGWQAHPRWDTCGRHCVGLTG